MNTLTAVFQEAEEGGYVCWIEEIPEAMSQGESKEEAKANLMDALSEVIKYRREQAENEIRLENKHVTRETLQIAAFL